MSNPVIESLRRLAQDLTAIDAAWALIGGFAVSARAEPRFTRDVDVCVAVADDGAAEQIARALVDRGYVVATIIEHEERRRLSTVRLVSPVPGGVVVDLLFASSGIEPELVGSSESLELIPGLVAPVARAAALVVLKLLARDDQSRPQDAADLVALRPRLTLADEGEVHHLAELVMDRGYHRDRDLVGLATAYLTG